MTETMIVLMDTLLNLISTFGLCAPILIMLLKALTEDGPSSYRTFWLRSLRWAAPVAVLLYLPMTRDLVPSTTWGLLGYMDDIALLVATAAYLVRVESILSEEKKSAVNTLTPQEPAKAA